MARACTSGLQIRRLQIRRGCATCRAITARANDALNGMGLTIVRLIVHPAIWAAVLTWFRFIVRNLGKEAGWGPPSAHGQQRSTP